MNRTKLLALGPLAAALIISPGCAGHGGPTSAQDRTPAYSAGYKDGCASGRASQGSMYDFEKKDAGRFDSDKQYAQGWTDAFRTCAYEQSQKMAAGNGR